MNKTEKRYYDLYNKSYCLSVCDCYKRPSSRKIKIENAIIDLMAQMEGYEYRVITHNSQFFTCGFKFELNGIRYLLVIAPTKSYEIKLNCDIIEW